MLVKQLDDIDSLFFLPAYASIKVSMIEKQAASRAHIYVGALWASWGEAGRGYRASVLPPCPNSRGATYLVVPLPPPPPWIHIEFIS